MDRSPSTDRHSPPAQRAVSTEESTRSNLCTVRLFQGPRTQEVSISNPGKAKRSAQSRERFESLTLYTLKSNISLADKVEAMEMYGGGFNHDS